MIVCALVAAVCGCESEEAEPPCAPDDPACELEDFDDDGVANLYDEFPEDPTCSEQNDDNCGACGLKCVTNATCDAGACRCAADFKGENCDECADPKKAGLDCDECADPAFTGDACDTCTSPLKTGENCATCIDELFTGDACDVCVDPKKKGPACETCKDPSMTGEDCDEPVAPNPEDALVNCLDYRACAILKCSGVEAEEQESCTQQALAECGDPQDEAEAVSADALVSCMLTECDSLDETAANYECWRQSCLPELVACATPSFGDTKCELLGACFNICGEQLGDIDWGCVRACFETGTQKAVTSFIDLDFCLRAECYESADIQQCKQQVLLNTPICQIPLVECVMND